MLDTTTTKTPEAMRRVGMQLGNPMPRRNPALWNEFAFVTVGPAEYLPMPKPPARDFFSVLGGRQTRRSFSGLSDEALSTVLWYTSKTLASAQKGSSTRWEHRVPPSAGGRHPIDVVLARWPSIDARMICLYDPLAHATRALTLQNPKAFQRLLDKMEEVVPPAEGVLFWHVAQFHRTLAAYSNGESLVWRDAGALTAVTCLVAEAIDLACCPIGITGEPWLSEALGSRSRAVGVGGCIIGSRQ